MQAIFLGSVALAVGAALPVAADEFFGDLQRPMQQGRVATRDAQPLPDAVGKVVGGGQRKAAPPEESFEGAGLKRPPEAAEAPPAQIATLHGKDLQELQTLLAILAPVQGFPAPSADGKYGPRTQRAIEGFQAENGLPVDGKATPEVLQAAANVLRSVGSAGTAAAAGEPPAARPATKEQTGGARPTLAGVTKTPDGSTLTTDALTQLFVGNTIYYTADVAEFETADMFMNPWGAADDMANREAIKAYEHQVYFHPDLFYFQKSSPLPGADGTTSYEVGRYQIKHGTYFGDAMLCRNFRHEGLMQESCFVARRQADEVHLKERTRRVMNYGEYLAYDEWGSWREVEEHEREDQGYLELIELSKVRKGDSKSLTGVVCKQAARSLWEAFEKAQNAGGNGTGINPCLSQ